MIVTVLFYIACAVAIAGAIAAISRSNMVHALLNVIVSFIAVGVVFFLLGAPFAAMLQIIIYAGAIMVLFLFAIMLCNVKGVCTGEQDAGKMTSWFLPSVLALILAIELAYVLLFSAREAYHTAIIGPKAVGIALFGPYVLCVELASTLLLAALVGACRFSHRTQPDTKDEGEPDG